MYIRLIFQFTSLIDLFIPLTIFVMQVLLVFGENIEELTFIY